MQLSGVYSTQIFNYKNLTTYKTYMKIRVVAVFIRWMRLAFSTAEVETTTAATTKVTASDDAAEYKQSLKRQTKQSHCYNDYVTIT